MGSNGNEDKTYLQMRNNRMYLQIEWLHNAKFLGMKVC
jgi:hypothetical protein